MKAWKVWSVPAIASLGFIFLVLTEGNLAAFLVLHRIGPMTSEWLWANITVLGDTLVALALCLPLWRRRPDLVWALLFAVLLATLWARGLKPLADVARPAAVLTEGLQTIGPAYKSQSFPSGHATTAFTLAGMIALGLGSRAWTIAALVLAVLVAVSRAVVGVHWPLDLLAGAFGGWLSAAGAIWLGARTQRVGMKPAVQWTIGLLLVLCAALLVIGHPKNDYPQADLLLRALGLACLFAAGARLNRDFRRRPGL